MFRIRSNQSKETVIAVSLLVFIIAYWIFALGEIIPTMISIYSPIPHIQGKSPVDEQTLDEAVKLINDSSVVLP